MSFVVSSAVLLSQWRPVVSNKALFAAVFARICVQCV